MTGGWCSGPGAVTCIDGRIGIEIPIHAQSQLPLMTTVFVWTMSVLH